MAIPLATLQIWLDEALTARQNLMLGKKAVRVRSGEEEVTFTPADKDKLDGYIGQLQSAIAAGSVTGSTVPSPIYFRF